MLLAALAGAVLIGCRSGGGGKPAPASRPAPKRPAEAESQALRDWEALPVADPRDDGAASQPQRYITTTRRAVGSEAWGPPQGAPPPGSNPSDLAAQPLAGIGMTELKELPLAAVAPPGATKLYAFRQNTPEGGADTIAYSVRADLPDLETFYRTRLGEMGYNLAGRGATLRAGGLSLAFLRDRQLYYYVNMHPADNSRVKVVLMIARPKGP